MNKLLPALIAFFLVFSIPSLSKAAELAIYPNTVYVSVQKAASLTITAKSDYQLINSQTSASVMIPANTAVSVKYNGASGIAVSFPGVSQTSTNGFLVQELITPGVTSVASLSNGNTYRGSFLLKINGSSVEVINFLDLEDYVKGVIPNEMPASWSREAVKAQAIASRSYAAASKSTLSSTVASQVYKGYGSEDARSNAAVEETKGVMVRFAGKPIQALFYSSSGGQTANYGDVWNSKYAADHPYLISVPDEFEISPYTNWTVTVNAADILNKFGFPAGTKLYDIKIMPTGWNGEVSGVSVKTSNGDKTITGSESDIRKLFPVGSASNYNILYSNWFTLVPPVYLPSLEGLSLSVQTGAGIDAIDSLSGSVVQTADGTVILDDSPVSIQTANGVVASDGTSREEIKTIVLNGKGFGHRLGMSQYGAKGYAEQGWSAAKIIQHYYQGTEVY